MTKIIIKVVIIAALILGISNYMAYVKTGKTLFDVSKLSMPDISFNTNDIKDSLSLQDGKNTLYKWVDADGKTQYSQTPPAEKITAQKITVDPNTNVVQAVKVREVDEPEQTEQPQIGQFDGSTYNPETVKQLMDDAKNVQKVLKMTFHVE